MNNNIFINSLLYLLITVVLSIDLPTQDIRVKAIETDNVAPVVECANNSAKAVIAGMFVY